MATIGVKIVGDSRRLSRRELRKSERAVKSFERSTQRSSRGVVASPSKAIAGSAVGLSARLLRGS